MEKNLLIATASAVSVSALTLLAYRYLARRREAQQNVYETQKYLGEYLIFHFGKADELLPYGVGPRDALEFPTRCALECIKYTQDDVPSIALDIGCAVGHSTFELAKRFNQVVGIDFSHNFIETCNKLKVYGKLPYTVQTEGSLVSEHVAEVDPDIDRSRLSFFQGDACNLPSDLGQFGCVLAANIICRLRNPYQFLDRLPFLVAPGGILVIASPYTWLEQFTPKSIWLGGYKNVVGDEVTGFDNLKRYLGPNFELLEDKQMPYLIRETARENQWAVSHTTIWKRRKSS